MTGTASSASESARTLEGLHRALTVLKRDYFGDKEGRQGLLKRRVPSNALAKACGELCRIQRTTVSSETRMLMLETVFQMMDDIERNDYSVTMATGENMACYVREYDVEVSRGIDYLKLVYWYCHGAMALFTGLKRDIAKIALLLMMDKTVEQYTDGQPIDRASCKTPSSGLMLRSRARKNAHIC